MSEKDLDHYKEKILQNLRQAGAKGSSKSGLKIGTSGPGLKAFQELVKEREIANLGSVKKTRYVLREFNTPLEIAYETIEKKIRSGQNPGQAIRLGPSNNRTKLVAGLPVGSIRRRGDEAIDLLVKEKKLIRLKYGNSTYFLHIDTVEPFLLSLRTVSDQLDESRAESVVDRERVLQAYREITRRIGFSNVRISDLQQETGISMDTLKIFLMQESEDGGAVLSYGDWSLSSEETRSGAIYLHGKPHLLVRFKE
ncbi:MAG: hypothetical protein GY866_29910 [Proteobacteria bacterium]|nr:hypothetical protein [Pseudomonadota bacterium]